MWSWSTNVADGQTDDVQSQYRALHYSASRGKNDIADKLSAVDCTFVRFDSERDDVLPGIIGRNDGHTLFQFVGDCVYGQAMLLRRQTDVVIARRRWLHAGRCPVCLYERRTDVPANDRCRQTTYTNRYRRRLIGFEHQW